MCILDILCNIPCSTLSDKQINTICWGLKMLDINDTPSGSTLKNTFQRLQSVCGVKTIHCDGALGHVYYMNDLLGFIAQV